VSSTAAAQGSLAVTGVSAGVVWGLLTAALLLLGIGGALVIRRRLTA
jgi:hypothetical protein